MWHASVAVLDPKVRRTVPVSTLEPAKRAEAEDFARWLLRGVGQPPDAVGSELAEVVVHRRRRLTDEEAARLDAAFWESEGAPACPAMAWEDG